MFIYPMFFSIFAEFWIPDSRMCQKRYTKN